MATYRAALAYDKQLCSDFQAELDATEERGVFADTPWIPGELKEVVEVVLGCEGYPDDPEDVYRPPATSTSEAAAHIGDIVWSGRTGGYR